MTTHEFALGDYVETTHHHYRGRVYKLHPDGCPESDDWLAIQTIPVDEYKRKPWISVLVHGGGAVVVPEALAWTIEPFPFENSYADQHFGAEVAE